MWGIKATGIIIGKKDLGEADKILTVFTREYGKLHLVARGSRKLSSKRVGTLELFNYIRFIYFSGRSMESLGQVDMINSFAGIKDDLDASARAYVVAEVVDNLTPLEQESKAVFDDLVLALQLLSKKETRGEADKIVRDFEKQVLKDLGFWSSPDAAPQNDHLAVGFRNYIERLIEKKLRSPQFVAHVNRLALATVPTD